MLKGMLKRSLREALQGRKRENALSVNAYDCMLVEMMVNGFLQMLKEL